MTRTPLDISTKTQFRVTLASIPLILTACFAMMINLIFSWPGIMTWDSNNQYMQAVSGNYDDWFPPIMAVVWRVLLNISSWGTGLLTLHLAAWWCGIAVFSVTLISLGYRKAAWISVGIGATPLFVFLNSFILKDVGLTASIMLAFSLIFFHRALQKNISIPIWIIIVTLFSYDCLVRQNGVFAVAPLICYAVAPWLSKRIIILLSSCFMISVAVIALSGPINHYIIHAKDGLAKRSLILFDTTGIAYWSRDNSVFRRDSNPPLDIIDTCYDPALWDNLAQLPCKPVIEQNYVTTTTMILAIVKHPFSYLKHRLMHFNSELFFWSPSDHWKFSDENRLVGQPVGKYDQMQQNALRFVDSLPFFSPAFCLTILLVISFSMIKFKQAGLDRIHEAVFFLSLSAILYTLGFALVGVANIYRYYEYTIICCIFTVILYTISYAKRLSYQNSITKFLMETIGLGVLLIISIARLSL